MKHRKAYLILITGLSGLLVACGGGGGGGGGGSGSAEQSQAIQDSVQKNSVTLKSIEPSEEDYSDLASFGAAVGDAKIVFMNESDHGMAETYRLYARLVKYLHQEKGFDAMVSEGGIFDYQRMIEMKQKLGVSYLDSAPGRIYFDTSRSTDGRVLVKMMDDLATAKNPLPIFGMDMMMAGESSTKELFPRFEYFLKKNGSTLPDTPEWAGYRKVALKAANLVQSNDQRPSAAERAVFNQVTDKLVLELCATPYAGEAILESKGFWCRITQSFESETRYLWNLDGDSLDWQVRDIAQAANAAWAIEGPFKGKKIIIFNHTMHGLQHAVPEFKINIGTELARMYPGQVHTVITTAGQWRLADNRTVKLDSTNDASSLEYYLGRAGGARYMAYPKAVEAANLVNKLSVRQNHYQSTFPSSFGTYYQSLFYLPSVHITDTNWTTYPAQMWPQAL